MPKPPPKPLPPLRDEVLRVAKLARIPDNELELFCDSVCDTVKMIWQVDRRAVSSKPDGALIKAAKAARNLNEAVCSLKKTDRTWVDSIAARHPRLSQEERLRGATEPFQTNELNQTVWLLAFLFSTAIGKYLSPLPGTTGHVDTRRRLASVGAIAPFDQSRIDERRRQQMTDQIGVVIGVNPRPYRH